MKNLFKTHEPCMNHMWITRFLLALTILLAFFTGYFHALFVAEQKRYARLEDLYVRVRGELGREETQRLIDFSREKSDFSRENN